ncbi:hypothetical protein M422DRAFT_53322 [Sphaerobolus stellatus SS14]|uniref:Uncharacterized protein n=1 Tax=Sphaerobolus stellatus (strain SS14) TaxID=990650 RepID=A0A0C9V253_SPHS4|nr:hypothetical protein M422DRAFT_53322 [Sphaerobolus stellatus SS14]
MVLHEGGSPACSGDGPTHNGELQANWGHWAAFDASRLGPAVITPANQFGVYRRYIVQPTYDPDGEVTLEEVVNFQNPTPATANTDARTQIDIALAGTFPNYSTYALSSWYIGTNSGERSAGDFNALYKVFSDQRFRASDVEGFTAAKVISHLESLKSLDDGGILAALGPEWKHISVPLRIPEGKQGWTSNDGRAFAVQGLHHKSICSIPVKQQHLSGYMLIFRHLMPSRRLSLRLIKTPFLTYLGAHSRELLLH